MNNVILTDILSAVASVSSSTLTPSPRRELLPEGVTPARTEPVTEDELLPALQLQKVNATLQPYGVEFELSEDGKRTIIRIVDCKSGEVLRQIPSEALLQIARRLDELRGLLLREKV